MRHIELNTAASLVYDVVVVGAGIAVLSWRSNWPSRATASS